MWLLWLPEASQEDKLGASTSGWLYFEDPRLLTSLTALVLLTGEGSAGTVTDPTFRTMRAIGMRSA
jgi:hypothetical protein